MAAQTAMNGKETHGREIQASAARVRRSFATLANELVTLTELQARLAVLDLEESGRKSLAPAGVVIGGTCLALGAVPVLLLGIAWLLVSTTTLPIEAAALIVAAMAVLIGAGCIYGGYLSIRQACKCLHRSREEFRANMQWIKRAIQETTNRSPF